MTREKLLSESFNNSQMAQSLYRLDGKKRAGYCCEGDCPKHSSFGVPGAAEKYCADHKEPGMKDVKHKTCDHPGCPTQPIFGVIGGKPTRCKDHILPDMIDVKNRKCPCCNKNPTYGYPGHQPTHCKTDMLPGMIDLKHDHCELCTTRPCFGVPGGRATRCKEHILPGMEDVVHDKCECPGCPTRPSFGLVEGAPSHCERHKDPNMRDVVNKKCTHPVCKGILATFGKLFGPTEHCFEHKLATEYRDNHPKCECDGCTDRPLYTNDGTNYPQRCGQHVLPNDKNVVEKPCGKCNIMNFINEESGLCNDCNDFFVKKVHLVKERRTHELLLTNGFTPELSNNVIPEGCIMTRPDEVIPYGVFKVVLETDEHQHRSYSEECETRRMQNIFQAFGGFQVLFIRYNPDAYKPGNGMVQVNLAGRERKLVEYLNAIKNSRTLSAPLIVTYLFYDGYDGRMIFYALDPFKMEKKPIMKVFAS